MTRQLAQPSPPPDSPRRFRLHRFQLIGIPVVFLLPVALALAGLLGKATITVRAESTSVVATIRYPSRLGYEQLGTMEVWVENVTRAAIDTVTVAIDTAYANRFFQMVATPPFEESYSLSMVGLAPGERRLANIEVQAEQYGIHEGELRVIAGDTAIARLRTVMFP
jgi:hypothetical protein